MKTDCVCVCTCVIFNPWVTELNAWFNLQQTRIQTGDFQEGCLRVVIPRPVPHIFGNVNITLHVTNISVSVPQR